jgi:hypothetical protein
LKIHYVGKFVRVLFSTRTRFFEPGMVAQACNSSTCQAEAEREFKASLGYIVKP